MNKEAGERRGSGILSLRNKLEGGVENLEHEWRDWLSPRWTEAIVSVCKFPSDC